MTVKIGSKRIEFEKGKAAIAVGTPEKLPSVIEALIKAVRFGELDEQLNQSGKSWDAPAVTESKVAEYDDTQRLSSYRQILVS